MIGATIRGIPTSSGVVLIPTGDTVEDLTALALTLDDSVSRHDGAWCPALVGDRRGPRFAISVQRTQSRAAARDAATTLGIDDIAIVDPFADRGYWTGGDPGSSYADDATAQAALHGRAAPRSRSSPFRSRCATCARTRDREATNRRASGVGRTPYRRSAFAPIFHRSEVRESALVRTERKVQLMQPAEPDTSATTPPTGFDAAFREGGWIPMMIGRDAAAEVASLVEDATDPVTAEDIADVLSWFEVADSEEASAGLRRRDRSGRSG